MIRPRVFLPGSKIGVMGGGQLGRMFAIAARKMGYRVHTFSPEEDTPTGQLADVEISAPFEDYAAVEGFARNVDVITFEFENIPIESVEVAGKYCEVRPAGRILHLAQNRTREKEFLQTNGLPIPQFAHVHDAASLAAAVTKIGTPCVLKTASFGYDGKGQQKIASAAEAASIEVREASVLEKLVDFSKEISVLVARGIDGAMETYPVCENIHRQHILDLTIVPASVSEAVENSARKLALTVAEHLDLVGLLAVEMFVLPDDSLLINELAPRPHNSGHFSFDACITSQFEQQLRAVCGLPLGSTELLRPVAMANLLGDLWKSGEPDWSAALRFPDVKLHLYGKTEPREGRKMGHLVAFGADTTDAAKRALAAREALSKNA
ncbi:MAG: 5-(carboxyamino)imidazole ribonucleotide synthase [Chthoniobacter sp.]|jgi:5-(carboxyamino)imidazole ribonucleotide synthase|nr:5-(carboxyamino)imidazole ribonucleotide synthase [Chthoniobacter sp.]